MCRTFLYQSLQPSFRSTNLRGASMSVAKLLFPQDLTGAAESYVDNKYYTCALLSLSALTCAPKGAGWRLENRRHLPRCFYTLLCKTKMSVDGIICSCVATHTLLSPCITLLLECPGGGSVGVYMPPSPDASRTPLPHPPLGSRDTRS